MKDDLAKPTLDYIWQDSLSLGGFYHRASAFYSRVETEMYINKRFDNSKKTDSARKIIAGKEVMINPFNKQYAVMFDYIFDSYESAIDFINALKTLCPELSTYGEKYLEGK